MLPPSVHSVNIPLYIFVLFRWPWLLHHIAKEYRDSAEDKDSDVLAFNIVQVCQPLLSLFFDVSLSAPTLPYRASAMVFAAALLAGPELKGLFV